jgi:hypothetical protein
LPDLARTGRFPLARISDPETHVPYEFHPKTGTRYELCANFSSNAPSDGSNTVGYHSGYWRYGKGNTCWVLDASEAVPW